MDEPDIGHAHEALHTAHVLICTWDDHVKKSLFVENDAEVLALAEQAEDAMAKVYQAIGQKMEKMRDV